MKKYVSFSRYPGKVGEYFYSKFFEHYGISAVYEPQGTDNLQKSLEKAVMDDVAGISVSMPFKQTVLNLLDKKTSYCELYNSCNTINIENNLLVGYNADYYGMQHVCKDIPKNSTITILGNGAMASMFTSYLEYDFYAGLRICARSSNTWEDRHLPTDVIINCTALGTSTHESPYEHLPAGTKLVIDLAIKDNDLQLQCQNANVKYKSGKEFYKEQFLNQFKIYTGIVPDSDLFNQFERQLYEKI